MATTYLSNQNIYNESEAEGELIRKRFEQFFMEFEELDPVTNKMTRPYHIKAETMRLNKRTTLQINCKHFVSPLLLDLIDDIYSDFFRLEPFIRRAAHNFIYQLYPGFANEHTFYLAFTNTAQVEGIRAMRSAKMGRLLALRGTVTKISETRPELIVGKFKCTECGSLSAAIEQQFVYTTPKFCSNKQCGNRLSFELVRESSSFVDWQKITLQELDSDLPTGAAPRHMELVLRNELVESAQPGDRVVATGTLIVVPDEYSMYKPGEKHELWRNNQGNQRVAGQGNMEGVTGLAMMGVRDLNLKNLFLANNVQVNTSKMGGEQAENPEQGESLNALLENMADWQRQEINSISKDPDVFDNLAALIAPTVYGNKEIRKGILLTLFGGVNKRTREGMKIRGDLNMCIVGDPATAKSQFLQYVHRFIPRAVYTCGKGSTSAGLTAAINRDSETHEFTIEAGALILADNGVCCIDEFDKMDEKDMVAIHEAMEQQTITISKAGIHATLNSRCSVIAAANPIMGRYDKTKTLRANINLSPPLMSRFDLFFVVTDECDEKSDMILARYMLHSHRSVLGQARPAFGRLAEPQDGGASELYKQASLRRYLNFARRINPRITPEAAALLQKGYLRMRANELSVQKSAYRITVRQLESLIRLSEAIAKVHLSLFVTPHFVAMAFDLLSKSMISISHPDILIEEEEDPAPAHTQGEPAPGHPVDPAALANGHQADGQQMIEEKLREKKKVTLQISHDEYERISKALVHLMQGQLQGMTRSDLTNLFLNSDLAKITTLEKLTEHEKLVQVIIKRMTVRDKIFLLNSDREDDPDPVLILHPQFDNNSFE